jgi:hypothetical protein
MLTHDELLIEVNRRLQVALYNGDIPALHALRAVVELHKPSGQGLGYAAYCHQCMFNHGSGEIKNHAYPCPTIQAIEKELQ